jgi:hypothetical protein
MNTPLKLVLSATLLTPVALCAQQTGTAHPEDLQDAITTTSVTQAQSTPATAVTVQTAQTTSAEPVALAPSELEAQADARRDAAGQVVTSTQTTTVTAAPAAMLAVTPAATPSPQPAVASPLSAAAAPARGSEDPDGQIVEVPVPSDSPALHTHPEMMVHTPAADTEDGLMVTTVPSGEFELPLGTMLRVTLSDTLSTSSTLVGAPFYAVLTSDVLKDGKVILPARSTLAGRVTEVHEGRRIGGAASLHLRPMTVTLPDGSVFNIVAQVIDTDLYRSVRITNEGTIVRSDHLKATLASVGLVTGSTAVAGALIGGVPGAVIGAGIGLGIGSAVVLRQDHAQTLAEGTGIIFELTAPMDIRSAHQTALNSGR